MEPASIRYKNPGAMWGNALAIKWGAAKKAVTLKDGKGQGNNIAVFPTYVQGICAQLDLWRTSPNYRNKRFADAIAIWSGLNEVPSYIAFCKKRVPGLTENTIMNDAFWKSPSGIAFLKAQAWHEAGKQYPAPDEDWIAAQRRVCAGAIPTPAQPTEVKKSAVTKADVVKAVVVGGVTGGAVSGAHQGWGVFEWSMFGGGIILLGVLGYLTWRFVWPWWQNRRAETTASTVAFAPDLNGASSHDEITTTKAGPMLPGPAEVWKPSTTKKLRAPGKIGAKKTATERKSSKRKAA